jgi:hypothetical protein
VIGARWLTVVAVTATLATLSGCGTFDPKAPSGAVAGSADLPHLSQADFARVTSAAMRAAGTTHIEDHMTYRGKSSNIVGDVSFRGIANYQIKFHDETGLMGRDLIGDSDMRVFNHHAYVHFPHAYAAGKFTDINLMVMRPKDRRTIEFVGARTDPNKFIQPYLDKVTTFEFLGLVAENGLYLEHYRLVAQDKKMGRVPIDVLLDQQHLLRHATVTVKGVTDSWTCSDWGKRVDVVVPGPLDITRRVGDSESA